MWRGTIEKKKMFFEYAKKDMSDEWNATHFNKHSNHFACSYNLICGWTGFISVMQRTGAKVHVCWENHDACCDCWKHASPSRRHFIFLSFAVENVNSSKSHVSWMWIFPSSVSHSVRDSTRENCNSDTKFDFR